MTYRNGTYIAFHADGNNIPGGRSDIDFYQLMRAWAEKDNAFPLVNSHEKTGQVRDTSSRETLRRTLLERLRNSKNMVLILGDTTKFDADWVPFEIAKAVDEYKLPIIAAYTKVTVPIVVPSAFSNYWPPALSSRIQGKTAHVIHIPFNKKALLDAIGQFSHDQLPLGGGEGIYSDAAYRQFGLG
ncbi:TIR domain-containing protein [Xanthomonas sp. NCPPB 2632]|uniref:TIR domain-containing protein n=1 Tax=Xanthomonas sp. NCPPB 2632 TaxID=3240912 RepID=UPI003518E619